MLKYEQGRYRFEVVLMGDQLNSENTRGKFKLLKNYLIISSHTLCFYSIIEKHANNSI